MKHLEIEWRHFEKEGETCDRCAGTGGEVHRAIKAISSDLEASGWGIIFKETPLPDTQIAESNIILLNGIPIEEILPKARKSENCCVSCGEMLGTPTSCRTIEYKGQIHETIPAAIIREAVDIYVNTQNP